MDSSEKTHFGYRSVTADEKTSLVRGVFSRVASRYDLMNDLMSFGIHRLWKKNFVAYIKPEPHHQILDVAGGTGDIAFLLHAIGRGPKVTVCDMSEEMVRVGRDRSIEKGRADLRWTCGDASSLPFADDSFDLYTISFGLRNVTNKEAALREALRVLKPGGRFYCLEFSKVEVSPLDKLYQFYAFEVIPQLGRVVARDKDAYQYLVESIDRHPSQEELATLLREAGFSSVLYNNLNGGICAVHEGQKPYDR